MKKNKVEKPDSKLKKLQLSRETLHTLTSSDTLKAVGGVDPGTSPQCGTRPTIDDLCETA